MIVLQLRGVRLSLLVVAWLVLRGPEMTNCQATAQANAASKLSPAIALGGDLVAPLRRPEVSDPSQQKSLTRSF